MPENKELREKQNERRKQSNEPLTLESMMRDLQEEAEDQGTDKEQADFIKGLLDLEGKTR